MVSIEYVINDKKMLCLNAMHFDYGNGLQTIPSQHEIACIMIPKKHKKERNLPQR
jgi:hypothetical protein